MQQFVVPQFIDVESKIIGPLTVRQFVIFLIGAGLIFLVFKLASFAAAIFEGLLIFILTGAFAFLKINGRPFHYFLLNMIQTVRRPGLKVWGRELKMKMAKPEKEKTSTPFIPKKRVTATRLSELSLVVDTGGAFQDMAEEE